jgi:hypothetical protein
MEQKSLALLRVLLHRYHGTTLPKQLLICLPPNEATALLEQPLATDPLPSMISRPEEMIQKIHYSWLLPTFKNLSPSMQAALLNALPSSIAEKVAQLLRPSSTTPYRTKQPLPPSMRHYLLQFLAKRLPTLPLLPLPFLPSTLLAKLVELDKQHLVEVIDYLGLYDLANEIRHIIDQKRVKQIYACLSDRQKQFLRLCIHQKEKVAAPSLNLEQWNENPTTLAHLLHNRGIMRLGNALLGHHPDFVAHIAHTLDRGRGQLLLQYFSPAAPSAATPALMQQVLQAIEFLNNKSVP